MLGPLRRHCSTPCLFYLCFFSALLGLVDARAHDPFEITAEAKLAATALEMKVTMTASTASPLIKRDMPERVRLGPETFAQHRSALGAAAGNIFEVTAGGEPLELLSSTADLTVENDVEFNLRYQVPRRSPLRIHAVHVEQLGYGYGATVMVVNASNRVVGSKLLMGDDTRLEVPIQVEGNTATAAPNPPKPTESFRSFFVLGVTHILTGYDHLLFLASLLVTCRRVRSLFVIITCFTVAHSITLGLAALDVVSLPSRFVEATIAASIVFIAVENMLRREREPKGRAWITFAFGLIHGFGFASILRETGLGQGDTGLLLPLFSFNVGVEAGQIAVALVAIPLWWALLRVPAAKRYAPFAVSAVLAVAGLIWLLQRTVV